MAHFLKVSEQKLQKYDRIKLLDNNSFLTFNPQISSKNAYRSLNPGTPEAGMRYPRQLSESANNILPLFIVTQDPNVILKNP